MVKKLLMFFMIFALAVPLWAGEKTVTISRNEGLYEVSSGVYYCTKGGITMTFSSGLNNVNYLVEHQQIVFDIFSTNYVIKKIKFNCLDNTTDDNLDCFYWGPSTISEFTGAPYTATGTYTYSGFIGTWVGGSTPSKYVKFVTEAKPVRFGSVEITYDKEFGDIYEKVTDNSEIENGQTYALVSQNASKALGKEDYYSSTENLTTFTSTPVTLLDNNNRVKVTDEVQLIKLESSGNSSRPWYIKVGDNYLRRRSSLSGSSSGAANGQGFNLYTESSVPSGREQYFRTSISVSGNTNNNALIRFEHYSSETTPPDGSTTNKSFAIRHYNGGSLFRDMDYSSNNQYASNQRVYLYKPAQSYEVTTECLPSNGGYITLGDGILTDAQGKNWSQHFDNVSFFVGPTEGWGVGAVTVTDVNSKAVTTLTPTNTSDFGNDYSFEMPANDVKITANFLQPYNIDTICTPNADAGEFNFISGYTDFNGQHKSNEGKTVTFKPIAADGYMFNSVTITNNGTTTTLTPDANGVYSFEMPGNDVTLTANFEEAHDLYLLGTVNGETAWHAYGPKFTFDGENQEYYIDVYFKGDSLYNNGAGDPYGHFSLTKKISQDPNGWGEISGYRIYATSHDYWVEDGSVETNCFQTTTDQAFKIPAGVYRITVSKDLDQMTITEYKPTFTFTPAGGETQDNPVVVSAGTNVVMTSNLEQLVHDINPNESSHATFYNTTDNWATSAHSNTCQITEDGVTTLIGNANLGYIKAQDTAYYEIVGDLYLLGTANEKTAWVPYGPQFTYDADAQEYNIDVYFKGYNDDSNAEDGYGYFSLTTKIGSNATDWGSISGYRLYATSHDYLVGDGTVANNCFQTNTDQAFKIPAGVYHITVNKAKTQMSITEYPLTLTFDPVSGTTVAAGDPVNISSNIEQLVHAINPDEQQHAVIKYATSTDGSLPTPNIDQSVTPVTITAEDATTTVNAEAALGYIKVTGNANYIVPAPTVYSITTVVTPEGSNAGTITAPSGSVANETVTFTVTDNNPSEYALSQVEVANSYGGLLNVVDNGDGSYSFLMPADDVTIYADYVSTKHSITIVNNPANVGNNNVYHVVNDQVVVLPYDNGYYEVPGTTVQITAVPIEGYLLNSTTITINGSDPTENVEFTTNGYGTFVFEMPDADVTVTFNYIAGYNIITECFPGPECGSIDVVNHAEANEVVQFTVTDSIGFGLSHVTITQVVDDTPVAFSYENGTYSFTMPATDVKIKATFVSGDYVLTPVIVPEGAGYMTYYGPWHDAYNDILRVNGNQTIRIFQHPNEGWAFDHLEITDPDGNVVLSSQNDDQLYTTGNYDFTITAYYVRPYHNITTVVTPSGAGTINVDSRANEGSTVNFTITPNQYDFGEWDVFSLTITTNGTHDTIPWTLDNGTYSFVMPTEDVTITAEYRRQHDLIIRWTPDEGGAAGIESPSGGLSSGGYYMQGEVITFKVIPNTGFEVARMTQDWSTATIVDNGDGTYSFVMPSTNLRITVYFQPTGDYQINLVSDPAEGGSATLSGNVKIENGNYSSNEGMSVIITPTPASHWEASGVDAVDSDGNPVNVTANGDGTYTMIMPASNVTVTTHYILSPYNISTSVSGSGAIVLSGDAADKNEYAGQTVTFALVPGDGYVLQSFTVKYQGASQTIAVTDNGDGTYSFVMPEHDVIIEAGFMIGYTVSTVCYPAEGGTVELTSGVTGNLAYAGATVRFKPTANTGAGYVVETVKVKNNQNGTYLHNIIVLQDGSYAFTMPPANVTVEVYFGKKHTITTVCDPVDAGEIELNQYDVIDDCYAYAGHNVRFVVTAYDRYVLESVTLTNHTTNEVTELPADNDVYDQSEFSFEMLDADVTITAHYAVGYKVTGIVIPEEGGAACGEQHLDNGYVIHGDYFIPGKTVIALIDIEPGYVFKSATVTLDDNPEQMITLIDDADSVDLVFGSWYDKHFMMPAADVTITVIVEKYTPLYVIEHQEYKATEGDTVTVGDDLVVVWAAKDYIWAKDLEKSNFAVPLPEPLEPSEADIDYVKDVLHLQKHEWDQSNWVILDCSDLYPEITSLVERRKKLDDFVDHKIAGGTITGVYHCTELDYGMFLKLGKAQHVIKLTEEPVLRSNPVVNIAEQSLGYPGYLQDPREENPAYDYHYNHYIPTNFFSFYSGPFNFVPGAKAREWIAEDDSVNVFILPPQDQEVVQVWAVYAGADTIKENGTTKLKDKFTVYQYYRQGNVSQNAFDLPGGFSVPAENWIFNRLNSGYGDESYGRPGSLDNEQTGSTELIPDSAYLFHVAIKRTPELIYIPQKSGPNTPAPFSEKGYYEVYPLDMDSHDGTVTGSPVVWAVNPESREIVSVRYFNIMGQESKTPFDGINIVVTRYDDGSVTSHKILR